MNPQFVSPGPSALPAREIFRNVPHGVDIDQLRRHVLVTQWRVRAGQYLYRNGQAFRALYLVHAGSLKTCELADDGRERVTGFRMRGDLLGVESIGLDAYGCDVIALEDCVIFELPYPPVLVACQQLPELQARFTEAMAREIRHDRSWMLTVGTLSAEQRVAAFLLDIGARMMRLGLSGHQFILRMGRMDIASFLDLKHETVSRALSRLEALGYITVRCREVKLREPSELRVYASASRKVH